MLWIENIKLALIALKSNKMRALLTMLGIIIGIGSVITIMTVSSSLTASINDSFQSMGANNITIGVQQSSSEETVKLNGMKFGAGGKRSSIKEEDRITDKMIDECKKQFADDIDGIALSESIGQTTGGQGGTSVNLNVTGVNEEYFQSEDVTLLAGRKIKQNDLSSKKRVIMISDLAVENLFNCNNEEALTKKISVSINENYYDYYVVGVFKYEKSGSYSSESTKDVTTNAYIPLTVARETLHTDKGYTSFTVVTKAGVESISDLSNQIKAFMSVYYAGNEDYEISASTMESMTESLTSTVDNVALAISFIAGISLLVGGIGVMNIMLVSVTERTREIGTRKALGAKNSHIRLQFVVESMVICLVGGILGVTLGLIVGAVAASMLGYGASPPILAIFLSVGFSMFIGVFFGYYPANKAAKLDPIEALRYE